MYESGLAFIFVVSMLIYKYIYASFQACGPSLTSIPDDLNHFLGPIPTVDYTSRSGGCSSAAGQKNPRCSRYAPPKENPFSQLMRGTVGCICHPSRSILLSFREPRPATRQSNIVNSTGAPRPMDMSTEVFPTRAHTFQLRPAFVGLARFY